MKVGYEAFATGRHVKDHRDAWDIVRRADHPGTCLSSTVLIRSTAQPADRPSTTVLRSPGDRLFFARSADAPQIDFDMLDWSRHVRNMPGEGDLEVTRFMRAEMAMGTLQS